MNVMIAATSGGFTDTLRDTAQTFGWNPWLFLSQVISFVIVALLLRRFAYKPILAERKQQEAIATAEQILAKAREASAIEHERTMESLKRELGRQVVDTTAKVTGKVLTPEDQRRLQEETARQLAS